MREISGGPYQDSTAGASIVRSILREPDKAPRKRAGRLTSQIKPPGSLAGAMAKAEICRPHLNDLQSGGSPPGSAIISQQAGQTPAFVTAASPPDGGRVAAQFLRHLENTAAGGHGKHHTGTPHLVVGQPGLHRNPAEHPKIIDRNRHIPGFTTSHVKNLAGLFPAKQCPTTPSPGHKNLEIACISGRKASAGRRLG
jgi:hypothetical protein